jgi:hypothetical protein
MQDQRAAVARSQREKTGQLFMYAEDWIYSLALGMATEDRDGAARRGEKAVADH